MLQSFDPRNGAVLERFDTETTDADLARICANAAAATVELVELGRFGRARMLRSMAAALESRRGELVGVATRETGLDVQRLGGELTRTIYQLELFAEVLDDGDYLEAVLDHRADTPMGPRPDLRRMLVPVGAVGVFGASNFPFAFSVPGGDTASALAAGCPVVAKVHSAHPGTSMLSAEVLAQGAAAAGVKSDVVSLVLGQRAGLALVKHPAIQAVGFTGSLAVGRLLFDAASSRPAPIPFYGELGALNTLTVCRAAASARGEQIAGDLAKSFTLGVGQFCTKPGVAFLPSGPEGTAIVAALVDAVSSMPAGVMLSNRTATAYHDDSEVIRGMPGVTVLARGADCPDEGWWGSPLLLRAEAQALQGALTDECFGPAMVVVDYGSDDELLDLLGRCGPALTASIHADEDDRVSASRVFTQVVDSVGRVVWNGFPTGVAVAWAMQHGGPYPATTNAMHTSVGTSSIRRWLRPICLQDVPDYLLPDELRETPRDAHGLPRRVDGLPTAAP